MGGNVFKNCVPFNQVHTTELINILNQTLQQCNVDAIPIGSSANPVAGKFSNDLDVLVEESILARQFNTNNSRTIRKELRRLFDNAGYQTDQSGVSVHVIVPYRGQYHQADVMVVVNARKVSQFHIHQIPSDSVYKGVHKQLAFMYLAKQQNLLWSAFSGLYRRDKNGKRADLITQDLDQIAHILLGQDASAQSVCCFEAIMDSLPHTLSTKMLSDLKQDPSWK